MSTGAAVLKHAVVMTPRFAIIAGCSAVPDGLSTRQEAIHHLLGLPCHQSQVSLFVAAVVAAVVVVAVVIAVAVVVTIVVVLVMKDRVAGSLCWSN